MGRFSDRKTVTVTIANGTSISSGVNIQGYRIAAFITPASWTTASLTMQVSLDGTNYYDLFINGTEWSITSPLLTRWYEYHPAATAVNTTTALYFKLRSGSSASPVNQGADRAFTFILAPAIYG